MLLISIICRELFKQVLANQALFNSIGQMGPEPNRTHKDHWESVFSWKTMETSILTLLKLDQSLGGHHQALR